MKFFRKLRSLFRKGKLDAEMAEEMRHHVDLQTELNRKAGMNLDEARYAALRQFGNLASVQERAREARGWLWFHQVWQDLRYASRNLRNNPGFTFVVVAVLAIGIGANSAVFSIIDALLLRPLPVAAPGRLMVAAAKGPLDEHKRFPYPLFDHTGTNFPVPYPFFEQFRNECRTAEVAAVSGWTVMRPLTFEGSNSSQAESVNIEEVSGNYFSVLGVSAAVGRTLLPEDDRPGNATPVVVISYGFWRERLNSDPAVLGKVLQLDNVPLTIIGVAAPRFSGARVGNKVAFWVPINLSSQIDANAPWGKSALVSATTPWIDLLIRPHAGISFEQVAADIDVIYQRKLLQMDPQRVQLATGDKQEKHWLEQHMVLLPAGTGYAGVRPTYRQPAFILLAIVGFMQLLACANITGLLLARGARRQKEFMLRAALGASRGRLVRQMLVESLLLAGIAGVIGLLLAELGTRILADAAAGVQLWADWRMIAFMSVLTLVTGLAVGLIPGWRLSQVQLSAGLKEAGGFRRHRLNTLLVIVQTGLAFLLLVVAGLFARTIHNLVHADTGFDPRQRLLFDLNIPSAYKPGQRLALYQRAVDAVGALPGVENVSLYQGFEMLGDTAFVLSFSADGYAPPPGANMHASLGRVGANFFTTMGIPIVRGRDFGPEDDAAMSDEHAPLIISEWSAHQLFGDADPLGRHIKMRADFEIVGVAKDVRYRSVREGVGFLFYMPLRVWPNEFRTTFVMKTRGSAVVSARELRSAVQAIDAQAQLSSVRSIAERLEQNLARDRLIAHLTEFFGVFAVAFAAMGLFGLMSYSVSQRTSEFGVRLSLGATPQDILGKVIWRGIALGLMGSAAGVAGALGLTRTISSLLYGVPATDLSTFVVAGFGLMLILLMASLLPAWRAARVDPVVALRAE